MRVLLVHNFYGSSAPSGENKVFEAECAMLKRRGHNVSAYTRESDEIRGAGNGEWGIGRKFWGMVKGGLCTVGNPFAARAVANLCREFNPDIVHFHNTFPLISPLAVRAASKYAPVVMTLHNYRIACAAGVPTRDGKVCSMCLDKRCVWDGVKHRCYRGGLLATLPLAINIALYRKRLSRWVSRFIVLSEFQKRKMVDVGLPEEKIVVKGNFINHAERVVRAEKKNQIVCVGRLSDEKGIPILIEAWRLLGDEAPPLLLIGDGDNRRHYEQLAAGLSITFLGHLSRGEMMDIIASSKAIVQASVCWETFGLAVVEAAMMGVPAVVSNLGALPALVQNRRIGEVFEAGNAEALVVAIKKLFSRRDYEEVCKAARCEAEDRYSEDINYQLLMEIYSGVLK